MFIKAQWVVLLQLSGSVLFSPNLLGAWEMISKNELGEEIKMVIIFSEKYQVATCFDKETGNSYPQMEAHGQ